jgi:hypothetical protein
VEGDMMKDKIVRLKQDSEPIIRHVISKNMLQYLIRFDYDHYCQGYETETETVMIYAHSYEQACNVIKLRYEKARDFENLTFGVDGSELE